MSLEQSYKEWEVLRKIYCFDKYKRVLRSEPFWEHEKFYRTELACKDALRNLTRSPYSHYDYPGEELEDQYDIIPSITLIRYKYQKRKL